MIESLITSKTRIRLLVKFFLNPATTAYLRELSDEFGESTNGIRVELNRMAKAGILEKQAQGKALLYKASLTHPLFKDISGLVAKYMGIDKIVDDVVAKLGELEAAYLMGDYARGKDSGIVDLVLVGEVDKTYLLSLIDKVEAMIDRKIRFLVLSSGEEATLLSRNGALLIWQG